MYSGHCEIYSSTLWDIADPSTALRARGSLATGHGNKACHNLSCQSNPRQSRFARNPRNSQKGFEKLSVGGPYVSPHLCVDQLGRNAQCVTSMRRPSGIKSQTLRKLLLTVVRPEIPKGGRASKSTGSNSARTSFYL